MQAICAELLDASSAGGGGMSGVVGMLLAMRRLLTGLPALLTGAAPVSRVCQVFGLAKRLTVTRPAAQRRAQTHFPPANGRFGVGPAYTASFVVRLLLDGEPGSTGPLWFGGAPYTWYVLLTINSTISMQYS